MSMVCYPFDSIISGYDESDNPIYDRAANSQVMADWMSHYFSNGIFGNEATGNYGFAVTTAANGMNINVSSGACNIEGRFAQDDAQTLLTLNDAGSADRIDAIVLRLSLETSARAIFLTVIEGTPSANPVVPAIQRDSTIYDLKIAEVRIPAGSTTISQANIKDTRLNPNVCGLVAVPMKVFDTTDLFVQLTAALDVVETQNQQRFEEWFAMLQDILDENVAGHLQNEIESVRTSRIEFAGIDLTYNSENQRYEYEFGDADITYGAIHITADFHPELFLTAATADNIVGSYYLETDEGSCVISCESATSGSISGKVILIPTNVSMEGDGGGDISPADVASVAETLAFLGLT